MWLRPVDLALAAVKMALGSIQGTGTPGFNARARICKLLRSSKIDSKESIPPAYVAWRAFTTTLYLSYRRASWRNRYLGIDFWAP
jgi:hypothetical protein